MKLCGVGRQLRNVFNGYSRLACAYCSASLAQKDCACRVRKSKEAFQGCTENSSIRAWVSSKEEDLGIPQTEGRGSNQHPTHLSWTCASGRSLGEICPKEDDTNPG